MKGDMESLHMIGSEQLTAKLEEVNALDKEVNRLKQIVAGFDSNIAEANDKITSLKEDQRFVFWLQAHILNDPIPQPRSSVQSRSDQLSGIASLRQHAD